MAHGSHEFVLVGYSEHLERRPLKFVDPIPATLICSACGHIPRLTFYLLCGHVLCEPCYQSSATTSECVCPLDGEVSGTDDVTSKKYPADNLLKRKVQCWNEVNGCSVVLPASLVSEHVRNDCQYHVTRCPMCLAVVLSRDVCAHLKSQCTALVLHAAPEAQLRPDSNDRTHLLAFEEKIEQRVRGLDAKLAQLSLDTTFQSDKLCHNNNILKEVLTEQLRTASGKTLDCLAKSEAEMKTLVTYQQRLEQLVGELDSKLVQLSLYSGSQRDKLIELCHNDNHFKETLTEQFGAASEETLERLARNEAEVKALGTYQKSLEQRVQELDTKLGELPTASGTHSDTLVEVSRMIDNLKEAQTKEFGATSDGNVADMKASNSEHRESFMTATASALPMPPNNAKAHEHVVTGYAALKRKALEDGWCVSWSDKVYLLRYLISWGIKFKKDGSSVVLSGCIQFHEGREDDFIKWPFQENLFFRFIHPPTGNHRSLCGMPRPYVGDWMSFERPIGGSNKAACFCEDSLFSTFMEMDGFVENDQLLVMLEVSNF